MFNSMHPGPYIVHLYIVLGYAVLGFGFGAYLLISMMYIRYLRKFHKLQQGRGIWYLRVYLLFGIVTSTIWVISGIEMVTNEELRTIYLYSNPYYYVLWIGIFSGVVGVFFGSHFLKINKLRSR